MSESINLLYELKQIRYGKSIDEIKESENVANCQLLSLRLPLSVAKKNEVNLVDFGLMALVTLVMEPIFLVLAFYLFK